MSDDGLKHNNERLTQLRKNRDRLERRADIYEPSKVPQDIANDIIIINKEIELVERKIKDLKPAKVSITVSAIRSTESSNSSSPIRNTLKNRKIAIAAVSILSVALLAFSWFWFRPRSSQIIAGPFFGEIEHSGSGEIEWFSPQVNNHPINNHNFIAEVVFVNPYSAREHGWNDIIFFRNGYRVWITSEKEWGYGYYEGDKTTTLTNNEPLLAQLALDKQGENKLKLVVVDDKGCLFVNDTFVGKLELAESNQSGDIRIGVGEKEFQQVGKATLFKDFTIYAESVSACP